MDCKLKTSINIKDNFLSLVRPFVSLLPEIKSPGRTVTFQEKFVWTSVAVLIYLVSSQVPLFGIMSSASADPLYWIRMMMASNKGTLMDLGISPVVTSSMLMQMLVSSSLIKVNFQVPEDKILYDSAGKLIALIMTIGTAVVQVISGFYGDPKAMGTTACVLLVLQLIFSGIIIILLDELLSKYGIGSGVNLFIATNVCENILWKAFSPKVYSTPRGVEFEGCVIAMFHLLITRKNKFSAIYQIFFRKNLPNMASLSSTFLLFAIIIYLQGIRMELCTESTKVKGHTSRYPIKLLYSSTMPIIVQSYIISHLSTVSSLLYSKFPDFFLIRLLGVWKTNDFGRSVPVSGVCYLIYPPDNIMDIFRNPFSFTTYCVITLLSSAYLSRAWVDISESNQFDVARQLKNNKMTIKGVREQNMPNYLAKIIPPAAFMGGLFTGLVCLLASLLETIGSGTNYFLAASIIGQYFE
ncbi:preprotein translocase, SecY subunit, partial [Anncaliia algerae PRA109]